jgi:hypothetical protein
MTDWRNATCAECGAKCLQGETHKEHNAGWNKMVLMWDYLELARDGYPGWETESPGGGHPAAPPCVELRIKNKVDTASDKIATEWDDLGEGRFYYNERSDDGLSYVGEGEYYSAYFHFQKLTDAIAFKRRYGGSLQ